MIDTDPRPGSPAEDQAHGRRQRIDEAKDRAMAESKAILANARRWPDMSGHSHVRADATVFEQPVEDVPLDAYDDEVHQ